MSDMIDRQVAIDALTDENIIERLDSVYDSELHRFKRATQRIIAQLPSAQPEDKCGECDAWNQYKNYSRQKGEWVLKPHEKMLAWDCEPFSYDETYNPERHSVIEMIYHCPTCNYEVGDTKPIWKFCPMCGTGIREGDLNYG